MMKANRAPVFIAVCAALALAPLSSFAADEVSSVSEAEALRFVIEGIEEAEAHDVPELFSVTEIDGQAAMLVGRRGDELVYVATGQAWERWGDPGSDLGLGLTYNWLPILTRGFTVIPTQRIPAQSVSDLLSDATPAGRHVRYTGAWEGHGGDRDSMSPPEDYLSWSIDAETGDWEIKEEYRERMDRGAALNSDFVERIAFEIDGVDGVAASDVMRSARDTRAAAVSRCDDGWYLPSIADVPLIHAAQPHLFDVTSEPTEPFWLSLEAPSAELQNTARIRGERGRYLGPTASYESTFVDNQGRPTRLPRYVPSATHANYAVVAVPFISRESESTHRHDIHLFPSFKATTQAVRCMIRVPQAQAEPSRELLDLRERLAAIEAGIEDSQ